MTDWLRKEIKVEFVIVFLNGIWKVFAFVSLFLFYKILNNSYILYYHIRYLIAFQKRNNCTYQKMYKKKVLYQD